MTSLSLEINKTSHGARSKSRELCSSTAMYFSARNCQILRALCPKPYPATTLPFSHTKNEAKATITLCRHAGWSSLLRQELYANDVPHNEECNQHEFDFRLLAFGLQGHTHHRWWLTLKSFVRFQDVQEYIDTTALSDHLSASSASSSRRSSASSSRRSSASPNLRW